MANYLGRLENRMREMGVTTPKLYIMQSNGGVSTFKGSGGKTGGHGALRPRRRRHRVHGHLRAGRHQQHHHLRHGRHELRCRADPSGQSGDHDAGKNQHASDRAADARHPYRQRRRRHHRAHRRRGRLASRARTARAPIPVRCRTTAAAKTSRSPTPISSPEFSIPTISSAAA